MLKFLVAALVASVFAMLPAPSAAQTPCNGTPVSAVVEDSTGALIPGATLALDGTAPQLTGSSGRLRLPCVTSGQHELTATFNGFATATLKFSAPHTAELQFHLQAGAQVSVTVNADAAQLEPDAPGGVNGLTLAGKQLQQLADDPDDLLRELQQMAAAAGGNPANTTISVDGFQDSSALPPKDSIAYVQVAPDLFSAEYREPPFEGARVNVYTKPGAKAYHGALFATNSSPFMNAHDPFSTSSESIGKQRYGFDFTGPIHRQGSNFTTSLEHRSINDNAVVNAFTLDAAGNATPLIYNVPTPQSLWEGTARVDWQLGPKNIFFVSYQANVNHLSNVGVGGTTLQEAGYDQTMNDHIVRFSNVTTLSPKLINESRGSIGSFLVTNFADSTAPSLQVSGYFTGGGSTLGNQRIHKIISEFDDDIILNTKKHLIKTGFQTNTYTYYGRLSSNFNGTYVFTSTPTSTAAQNFATQTPYEFNNVAGTPQVNFTQLRFSAFYQDNYKALPNLTLTYGLRYFFETTPANFNSVSPRAGINWVPDKKKTWTLQAHIGIFNGQYSSDEAAELHREDGVQRITSLIYNPIYGSPFTGATPIHAERTLAPGFNTGTYLISESSVSKDLPFGFNINIQEAHVSFLTDARTVNINQPLNGNPYGPRPIAPNLDILQAQTSGHGQGDGTFAGLSNFKLKRVQFFLGALHLNIRDDTDDSTFFQPQSAYTDAGETTRRTGNALWQVFGNATIALPYKLSFSGNLQADGNSPFNIITGSDNDGDGNFNDRPQFAPAGSTPNGSTIFQTPFGLLTNAGVINNGVPVAPLTRNLGNLPWSFHLDTNLQRAFVMTHDPKAEHQQTITANIRSSNVLNHTNVTASGGVLGSPQFLVPYAADNGRRIEAGLRYSF